MLFTFTISNLCAQSTNIKRKLTTQRTTISPQIDGSLNDIASNSAPIATDFIEFRPVPGGLESKNGRTEVKFLYDDYAIYISGRMYDKPDSIVRELMSRDQIGNADFVGIVLDTFLDGINGYGLLPQQVYNLMPNSLIVAMRTAIGMLCGKVRVD